MGDTSVLDSVILLSLQEATVTGQRGTGPSPVGGITLLGLVSQPAGLVGARGARGAVQGRQLPVLPAAHAQQEPHHVRLLLPPQLLDVLVGTHGCLLLQGERARCKQGTRNNSQLEHPPTAALHQTPDGTALTDREHSCSLLCTTDTSGNMGHTWQPSASHPAVFFLSVYS